MGGLSEVPASSLNPSCWERLGSEATDGTSTGARPASHSFTLSNSQMIFFNGLLLSLFGTNIVLKCVRKVGKAQGLQGLNCSLRILIRLFKKCNAWSFRL